MTLVNAWIKASSAHVLTDSVVSSFAGPVEEADLVGLSNFDTTGRATKAVYLPHLRSIMAVRGTLHVAAGMIGGHLGQYTNFDDAAAGLAGCLAALIADFPSADEGQKNQVLLIGWSDQHGRMCGAYADTIDGALMLVTEDGPICMPDFDMGGFQSLIAKKARFPETLLSVAKLQHKKAVDMGFDPRKIFGGGYVHWEVKRYGASCSVVGNG